MVKLNMYMQKKYRNGVDKMRVRIRSKPFMSLLLVCVMLITMISAIIVPQNVFAEKNVKIDQLIMVSPYSDGHIDKMHTAVRNQEAHEGDADQHKWILNLNSVTNAISNDKEKAEKQAICVWAGEQYLDSDVTNMKCGDGKPVEGNAVDAGVDGDDGKVKGSPSYAPSRHPEYDGEPTDIVEGSSAAERNAERFARSIFGYDYEVEELIVDLNGYQGAKPSENHEVDSAHSDTVKATVYYDESSDSWRVRSKTVTLQSHKVVDTEGYWTFREDEYRDNNPSDGDGYWEWHPETWHWEDYNGNTVSGSTYSYTIPDSYYAPGSSRASKDSYEITYKTFSSDAVSYDSSETSITINEKSHIDTHTEHAKGYAEIWTEKGAKVYVFSLGPESKELGDAYVEHNEKVNAWNTKFTTCGSVIDLYEPIEEHNPYYANGKDCGKYYDEQMYAWIFHLMWNTILTLNPNDDPPEPIDETLYSVSSSLTSYMNNVLSVNGDTEQHASHTLPEASTAYVGNAGAFLGYGDSDYDFTSYITGSLSKTSSTIDYSSLLNIEGSTNEMYLYARYGRLLQDMGFDDTATKMTFGSSHMIPGALMFLVYVVSEGITLTFSAIFKLLHLLNPFQLFKDASNIADSAKLSMAHDGGLAVSPIVQFVSGIYEVLSSFSLLVLIPLFMALLIAGILLKNGGTMTDDKWKKVKVFLLRFVFVVVGVPLMGVMYTSTLDKLDEFTSSTHSSGTQMITSTFVDFKSWAQKYRLSPFDDGTFESSATSNSDSGSIAGEASVDTYTNLRKTAALLNNKVESTPHVDIDAFGIDNLVDVSKWTTTGLTQDMSANKDAFREVSGLLKTYTFGDFYTAGSFEADTMSTITSNHKTKIGRQQGLEEDEAPDNTNTLYELFDMTNETADWLGRTSADNTDIFTNNGDYSTWSTINIFSNGRLSVEDNTVSAADDVVYTDSGQTRINHGGLCSDSKVGLSTISMYNYLSSKFDDTQITIYSNRKAPSEFTKEQHFAVNLIGSGVARILYYLNCFAVLFVVSIIGVYYACSMLIQSVKRSIHMIMSIPGAMLGVLNSILDVIVTVVLMIVEVVGVMLCYTIVSELIVSFVSVLELGTNSLSNAISGTTIIGNTFATIGYIDSSVLINSKLLLFANLLITSCVLFVFGIVAKKFAYAFRTVYEAVMEYIFLLCVHKDVAISYLHRKNEVYVKTRCFDILSIIFASTKELLLQ